MSQLAAVAGAEGLGWALWRRQIVGIISLEARRSLLPGRRSLFVYFLAATPVVLMGLRLLVPGDEQRFLDAIGGASGLYAITFRAFFLRLVVFFGCVGVFTRLFRGDVLERTLHYYLLAPVRRDVLVAGKYLAGVLSTVLIFGTSTLLSFLLTFLPGGWAALEEFVLKGPGLGHLFVYLGLTVFACVGYGAIFLLVGLFFRNPIIPAAVILGWEAINFLLPPLLKKFSVIYYLESLCPVPVAEGPVTILAEPAPAWMSVPGLLLVTAFALFVTALKVRQMEISYGED